MPRGTHSDGQGSAPMSSFQGSAMTSVGGHEGQPVCPHSSPVGRSGPAPGSGILAFLEILCYGISLDKFLICLTWPEMASVPEIPDPGAFASQ